MDLIPGFGLFPREGHGNPLQYSCLKVPWTEEPGGLQSIGSKRVEYDWSDTVTAPIPWWLRSGEASAYGAGDPGSIPGLGRSPGEGNGNPLQYCCLENPRNGGTW